jgi:serine protease Do
MKCTSIVSAVTLAGAVWASTLAASAAAQPILNRVEQFVRDQIDSVRSATQPGVPAQPGYLGLTVDDRQDNGQAVRVDEVVPGGPAAKAGLQKGDVITSIGGLPIRSMDDMGRALQGHAEGTRLVFVVKRGAAERQQEVTLGRRPATLPPPRPGTEELPEPGAAPGNAPPNKPTVGATPAIGGRVGTTAPTLAQGPRLGVRAKDVSAEVRKRNNLPDDNGALVDNVTEGSPAARAGIPEGAVIVAFDGQPVNSSQELVAAVRAAGERDVEVVFIHDGQAMHTTVSFAAAAAPSSPTKREVRGRPIEAPVKPVPSEGPLLEPPADARTAALEARIRQLEERIAKLEAERKESSK